MTTSRIVRGTKARIFLYICGVLIITGIIACYNNTLTRLDYVKRSNEICHQQEENLSTQLQVISDYKQRLEKSLKTEKAEHQRTKSDLENKLNEEKEKYEKAISEANTRFNSLQQHFNMLKTQNEDLEAKLKEIQEELKTNQNSKESLNSKYAELQNMNKKLNEENANLHRNLEENVKDRSEIDKLLSENQQLQKELGQLKNKYSAYESLQPPQLLPNLSTSTKSSVLQNNKMEPQRQIQSPPNGDSPKSQMKSSTAASSAKDSTPNLAGVPPLLVPTVTPKTKKIPEGVVPVPAKQSNEEKRNELPGEAINNRYRNKINDIVLKEDSKKVDENVANEIFDQHNYDNFALEGSEIKNLANKRLDKNHIDQLAGVGNKMYEEEGNHEENEPEDDDPDYGDHLGRLKDAVVRN